MLHAPDCARRTILVVDDDDDIRAVVALALELAGFEVDVATNGLQALDKVRRAAPTAVILDLNMPRMGGEDFLYAWRAGVEAPGVPVVVISAASDALRAGDLGVDAYLPKPFDINDLVQRVAHLVDAPVHAPVAAPRDARVDELRDIAEQLAQVLGVVLGAVEVLADDPPDPDERHAVTAGALASAQRGSALVRRLKHLVGHLD